MSNAKYTPGPWEFVIKDDKYGKEPLVVGRADGEDLPVVCGCLSSDGDGHLIAAAPELLEALETLMSMGTGYGEASDLIRIICKPAIAKARGRAA